MAQKNAFAGRYPLPVPSEHPSDEGGKWLYLSPEWFAHVQGILSGLENPRMWTGTKEEIAEAIDRVLWIESNWLDSLPVGESLDCPECPESLGCTEFPPTASFIEYSPTDPLGRGKVQTNSAYPEGAWKYWGINIPFVNAQEGDVYTSGNEFFGDLRNDIAPIVGIPLFIARIVDAGFPRFKVNIEGGKGEVELHLLKIPQGGTAFITVDGKVDSGQFVDLASFRADIVLQWQDAIEQVFGMLMNGSVLNTEIVEFKFEDDKPHYIDVTFIPHVDTIELLSSVWNLLQGDIEAIGDLAAFLKLGFGGGLRKVVICGDLQTKKQDPPNVVDKGDGIEIQDPITKEVLRFVPYTELSCFDCGCDDDDNCDDDCNDDCNDDC